MKNNINIFKVSNAEELNAAHSIRQKVFVEEQQCPQEIEWEFEEESVHFLAQINGLAVGTARWRITEIGIKFERFAVLEEYRGKGVGLTLVKALLNDIPADANDVYLHAQIQAVKLYEKTGFIKQGKQFKEAGIQHYKMVLKQNISFT